MAPTRDARARSPKCTVSSISFTSSVSSARSPPASPSHLASTHPRLSSPSSRLIRTVSPSWSASRPVARSRRSSRPPGPLKSSDRIRQKYHDTRFCWERGNGVMGILYRAEPAIFAAAKVTGNALGMGQGAIQSINDMAISHPPCLHVWFTL